MIGNQKEEGEAYVYVPDGAKLNLENKLFEEITVEYQKRRSIIDLNTTKDLCGGNYDNKNPDGRW